MSIFDRCLHLLTNLCLRNERAFQQRMWRLFERKNEKEMKETKEKDKDQQKESWSLPGCSGGT